MKLLIHEGELGHDQAGQLGSMKMKRAVWDLGFHEEALNAVEVAADAQRLWR